MPIEKVAKEILPTQAGYDRWAEFYDGDDNPLVLLEELRIAPLMAGWAGLQVADIGCGTGRHALRLAQDGARVTALDFSEAMLSKAGRNRDRRRSISSNTTCRFRYRCRTAHLIVCSAAWCWITSRTWNLYFWNSPGFANQEARCLSR